MASGSRRAVVTAIVGNGTLTVLKFAVALPAHSAALMNEAVHSLMDTLNQIFLLIGLVQGERRADARSPGKECLCQPSDERRANAKSDQDGAHEHDCDRCCAKVRRHGELV